MDISLVFMLSSLMQFHKTLEGSASESVSSAIPLLFFTLTTVLAHAAALYVESGSGASSSSSWISREAKQFRKLATDQIWMLDPSIRDTQWRKAYGVSYPVFTKIVEEVTPYLQKREEFHVGGIIPADAAVAMVLFRLTSGHNLRSIAAEYRTGPATISRYTDWVTKALATDLYPKYVKIPEGQSLVQIIAAFRDSTGLQNMCGAIDGSHIKIHKRPDKEYSPGDYKCRHHFFAILLQVVCDHQKLFWDVCSRAPGSISDASHFRSSSLYQKLTNGKVLVDSVVSMRGNHIRPYIVGDWGYPLLSFLLTPFTGNGTGTTSQNLFDERLMRGRAVSGEAIGLLKGRWKILQNLNVGLKYASQTVVACCILHNICVMNGEPDPEVAPDPKENGFIAKALESERSSNYFGESMRHALLEDLQDTLGKNPF